MNLDSLMTRYGRRATLQEPDGWQSTAFYCLLQPLRYKNKMYLNGVNTQIGFNAQGHYLYIGPAEHDITKLSENAILHTEDTDYLIDRAEKVYCGDKPFYIWAIIRTIVEESEEIL